MSQEPERPASPSELYPGLYRALQTSGAIEDMKAFADSAPRASPAAIEARFASESPGGAAALRAFAARWFDPPPSLAPSVTPRGMAMAERIERLWDHLAREPGAQGGSPSLIALDHATIVPGGMFRESYYWDSCFTMIGLGEHCAGLRRECVDALAEQIDRFGFVPNGNRSYYLSRSQPPTFYASVAVLEPAAPERAWARYLPQLRREHTYWMSGEDEAAPGQASRCVARLPDGALLNRYWDALAIPRDECVAGRDLHIAADAPGRAAGDVYRGIRAACASGWDFSSRWFGDRAAIATIRTTAIAPVDLNALLFGLERAIEQGATFAGDAALASQFGTRAEARQRTMERWLWTPAIGAFDDLDLATLCPRGAVTAACAVPLFAGCATPAQAESTAALLAGPLLAPGGLVATSLATGEQWDAPNGWAPCHWMAIVGLADYGYHDQAEDLARRWLDTVARVYAASGRMLEKYDVVARGAGGDGEYPLQDGFGWTNGVTAALLRRFPRLSHYGETRAP